MDERMLRGRFERIRAHAAREREGHGSLFTCGLECNVDFFVALRRAKAHDNIIRFENCFHPRAGKNRQIERGKGTLAYDDGMDEFDRYVLGVSGVRASSK